MTYQLTVFDITLFMIVTETLINSELDCTWILFSETNEHMDHDREY